MKVFAIRWLRWLAWFVVATLFAAACVFLANWQFDRREQAVAKIERMLQNYDRTPIDYLEIESLSSDSIIDYEWHPVFLEGRYLSEKELLVRNRPIAGTPGFIQLVPFQLTSGEIVLLERGWIAADSNLAPAKSFTPSTEFKKISGRVKLSELTPNRESPVGFVTSIKLDELAQLLELPLEQEFYLRLIQEQPAEVSLPQPLSKPILDEGNHLSYAVQWILFAIMGFFALFWAIRQEQQFRRMEKDPSYVPSSLRKKITDGDIEDEILDASQKR